MTSGQILVVENEENWRNAIQEVLSDFDLKIATSLSEAQVELTQSPPYDLLIINMNLISFADARRDRLGVKLLEHTRTLNYPAACILITGDPDPPIGQWMKHHHVQDIFIKGKFDLDRIVARVTELVEKKASVPTKTINILILAAAPDDQEHLRLDVEVRTIDERLREAEFRNKFKLQSHGAVRYSDLSELLLRYQPHIVHFSGHGSKSGKIVLQDESGKAQTVEPLALKELFRIVKRNISCVVLNACLSQDQAEAIAQEIDCVVGMSREFDDAAAISFSAGFYRGLGFGLSVQEAFELGKNEIGLAKFPDADVPQLLVKPGVNAAEIKFC